MNTSTEQAAATAAVAIGAFMFVLLLAGYTAGMYKQIQLALNLEKTAQMKVVKK